MRSRYIILLGILSILFILDVAFGQKQSDPHIITVTKKIDVEKLNDTVEKLNTTVNTLNTTVEKLETTVGGLKTTVTTLEERTGIMLNLQYIILAGILGGPFLTIFVYRRFNKGKENVDTVDPALQELLRSLTEKLDGLVEKLDVPPLEEVPSRRLSTPRRSQDELMGVLKTDDYSGIKKV